MERLPFYHEFKKKLNSFIEKNGSSPKTLVVGEKHFRQMLYERDANKGNYFVEGLLDDTSYHGLKIELSKEPNDFQLK